MKVAPAFQGIGKLHTVDQLGLVVEGRPRIRRINGDGRQARIGIVGRQFEHEIDRFQCLLPFLIGETSHKTKLGVDIGLSQKLVHSSHLVQRVSLHDLLEALL